MDYTKSDNSTPAQAPNTSADQNAPGPSPIVNDPPAAPEPTIITSSETKPPPPQSQQPADQDKEKSKDTTPHQGQIFTSNDSKPSSGKSKGIIATIVAITLLVGGVAAGVYLISNQQLFSQKANEEEQTTQQQDQVLLPEPKLQCNNIQAFDTNWNRLSSSDLANLASDSIVRFTVSGTATSVSGTFDKARFTINNTQRAEVTQKRPGTDEFYDEFVIPEGATNLSIDAQVYHSGGDWI